MNRRGGKIDLNTIRKNYLVEMYGNIRWFNFLFDNMFSV